METTSHTSQENLRNNIDELGAKDGIESEDWNKMTAVKNIL